MELATRIREAQKNYFFAAIQLVAEDKKYFKYTDLPANVDLASEGEIRNIEWELRSEKEFRTQVQNQIRAALAILVIETDSALSDYFNNYPDNNPDKYRHTDTNDERRNARCIIYILRCALAHHPLQPTWNVTSDDYKDKIFVVPSINYTLDTTGLNGEAVDKRGLNWHKLVDLTNLCITYIK